LYQARTDFDEAKRVLVRAMEIDPMSSVGGRAQVVLLEMMQAAAAALMKKKD
jgi:hypothetical protein